MTAEQLILAAFEEAHGGTSELTEALAAVIRQHEQATGETITADRLQLKVEVERPKMGALTFVIGLVVTPNKVLPFKKVVTGARGFE